MRYCLKQHHCNHSQIIFTDNRRTKSQSNPIETVRKVTIFLCKQSFDQTGGARGHLPGELMCVCAHISPCSLGLDP